MSQKEHWVSVLVLIAVLVGVGVCIYKVQESEQQRKADKARIDAIANEVRPLIEECESIGSSEKPELKGKVIVYEVDSNHWPGWKLFKWKDGVMPSEWSDLKASPNDEEITIFFVSTTKLGQIGYYECDAQAYKARFDIYVIYWPEKQAVGMHTIFSDPPEGILTRGGGCLHDDVVGDIWDIYSWIESLPN